MEGLFQHTAKCLSHDKILCMIKNEIIEAIEYYESGNIDMAKKELADAYIIIEHYLRDHDTTPAKVLELYMQNKHVSR